MLTVLTGLPEVGLEAMHCQLVYSEVSAAAAPAEQARITQLMFL